MTETLNKRDWVAFYMSPLGRISRREFWLFGLLPIFLVSVTLGLIPVVGWLLDLVLMWCSIAITFKRFHDCGYPGWWSFVGSVPGVVGGVFSLIAMFSNDHSFSGFAITLEVIAMVVFILSFFFVYLKIGQPGPNKYGPDPLGAPN